MQQTIWEGVAECTTKKDLEMSVCQLLSSQIVARTTLAFIATTAVGSAASSAYGIGATFAVLVQEHPKHTRHLRIDGGKWSNSVTQVAINEKKSTITARAWRSSRDIRGSEFK